MISCQRFISRYQIPEAKTARVSPVIILAIRNISFFSPFVDVMSEIHSPINAEGCGGLHRTAMAYFSMAQVRGLSPLSVL